ncbi:MAG: hypothetical protein JWR26_2272 [Pedosphaera sp.]|nr:hypothetical protein [Pedosphaera sp.]
MGHSFLGNGSWAPPGRVLAHGHHKDEGHGNLDRMVFAHGHWIHRMKTRPSGGNFATENTDRETGMKTETGNAGQKCPHTLQRLNCARSHLINSRRGVGTGNEEWNREKKAVGNGRSLGRLLRCSSVAAPLRGCSLLTPRIQPKSLAAPSASIYEMASTFDAAKLSRRVQAKRVWEVITFSIFLMNGLAWRRVCGIMGRHFCNL